MIENRKVRTFSDCRRDNSDLGLLCILHFRHFIQNIVEIILHETIYFVTPFHTDRGRCF